MERERGRRRSRDRYGLLGSGEFLPWSEAVDERLLAGARPGRVLILPTASAPEGDEVFDRWGRMGLAHFERRQIPAEVVPLKARQDAERADLVGRVAEAALVYVSGGNPAYLASVLEGSAFWTAVLEGLGAGLAYAGCSAGVSVLGEVTVDSRARLGPDTLRPGLRLFPGLHLAPHWDVAERFVPGYRARTQGTVRPEERLLAIDDETAVVGDGVEWEVVGSGSASLLEGGAWRSFPSGSAFSADLMSD